jgi:tetratricopeptide (TPR) repeat protein
MCYIGAQMKRLYEIIADLESQIPDTKQDALPRLYAELADHLTLVNGAKQNHYISQILSTPTLDAYDPIRIKTEIMYAGNLLNQMDLAGALSVAEVAYGKACKTGNEKLTIEVKLLLALVYLYNNRLAEGEAFLAECIARAEAIGDHQLSADTFTNATFFYIDKDLVLSGQYGFQALEQAKLSGLNWKVGYIYSALGYWARANRINSDEYDYFKTGAELLKEEGADEYYGNALVQLSIAQKDKELFPEALQTLQSALAILEKTGNKRLIITTHYSIGRCYKDMKAMDMALGSFRQALALAQEENNQYEIAVSSTFIGHLYRDMDNTPLAIEHLEKGLNIFRITNRPTNMVTLCRHLHPLYLEVGETQKAYETLLEYTETRFKILDENRAKETAQLQAKYESEKRESELREMKIRQQQAELERSESELKAIKAQMNPHFIFNALNSIQEMFFIGDKRLANEHLGKFSQLTREVLRASGKRLISLSEEIDMLTKYLELEGLRFESDFTFSISVNDENVADDIMLPPMLIQPYVENSIRHGLLHKQGKKSIKVSFVFDEENKHLSCVIEDNGVGRTAAAEINMGRKQLHESFSTSANAKRLELLNQNRDEKIGVQYEDLAEGTKVSILIPVSYD